jgi:hypothetical protein
MSSSSYVSKMEAAALRVVAALEGDLVKANSQAVVSRSSMSGPSRADILELVPFKLQLLELLTRVPPTD